MSQHAVQVRRLTSIRLAVIRRQVRQSELSRVVPECCGLVWNQVRAQQAKGGRHVALYWDSSIRLEVGVELDGPFIEQADVVLSATPAGDVATTTHFGPYGNLASAHDAVHRWVRDNQRQLAGPSWEIYGHWLPEWNSDPSKIRTDVFYLLEQ
jgi:effector-binding domain-containing protein